MDNDTSASIRERAYERVLKRGSANHGDVFSDWREAEKEIHSEQATQHKGPAKTHDEDKRGHVTYLSGYDVENPT